MMGIKSNNLKNNTLIDSYVIIPKSQVGTPFDLSPEEWKDTRELMLKIKQYLDDKYQPDDIILAGMWKNCRTRSSTCSFTYNS